LQRPGVMETCSKNKRKNLIGALAIFISRGAE
jgi:hypothetical protein